MFEIVYINDVESEEDCKITSSSATYSTNDAKGVKWETQDTDLQKHSKKVAENLHRSLTKE